MNTLTNDTPIVGQQNLSLMLLANDLLFKAFQMKCTDFQIEPDADQVTVRYLTQGTTIKEMQLPITVHPELVFCYKVLAGLNIKDHAHPQDKHSTIDCGGMSVGMRVTAIPGDFGETIALTFKYSD